MFETLFQYPAIVARHRGGPFTEARERFLNFRASQGPARTTLQRYAQELLVVAERIDITSGNAIGSSTIEAAADRWVREQQQRQRGHGPRWSRELFVQTATDWLHFLGHLEVPKAKIVPFADRIADFAAYRRDERGLSPVTINNQSWHVKKFLGWLAEQNRTFADVSLEDVDAFLAVRGKRGWCRVSVAASAKALRAFFQHAAVRGWCTASIAAGIDGPRLFQHEGLPVGPSWPDVQRLIASTVGDSARDIRDRAILVLLATYGLRSGEVSGLRLEDGNTDLADIGADRVHAYIAGTGAVTRFWHRKYEVLRGFYRYAIARGYVLCSPLPKIVPKPPEFVPHIFSHEELQRLLDASACCESPRCKLQPYTFRMLILLLYGAALRISEALSLTLADVDLPAGILTIRESKFYKTRLVPMSPALTSALKTYVAQRAKELSTKPDAALFLTRNGTPLVRYTAENVFRRLRVRAGVVRHDGGRYQPRLHDLRHAAAVHRLVSWYRQGADVQRLLPQLATYLGHVHIAATQRYLTLTPELLHEASQRFEQYARGGQHE
jgi:integrase/recombinase XerD